MKSAGHDRGAGGAADVRLAADGDEEDRGADQLAHAEQDHDVHQHPHRADPDQQGLFEDGPEVGVGADRGHQDVEHHRADLRRPRAFQVAGPSEGEDQAGGGDQDEFPGGGGEEGLPGSGIVQVADLGGQPVAADEGQIGGDEAEGHDDDQVGEGGDARGALLEVAQPLLQVLQGGGIRAAPGVDPLLPAGEVEQDAHPDVGDEYIDDDHLSEQIRAAAGDLPQGDHVRAAADPGAAEGRHALPGVRGKVGLEDEQGERRPQDHAGGTGQEHDDGLRAQADDAGHIESQDQEQQRGGQQVDLDPGIEGRVVGENTQGGEGGGQEIAEDQLGDDREDPGTEGGLAEPEDQGQGGEQDGEDAYGVGDQGHGGSIPGWGAAAILAAFGCSFTIDGRRRRRRASGVGKSLNARAPKARPGGAPPLPAPVDRQNRPQHQG